jgi:hypothetical protein
MSRRLPTQLRQRRISKCLLICVLVLSGIESAAARMDGVCIDPSAPSNPIIDYAGYAAHLPKLAPGVFPSRPDSVRFNTLLQRQGQLQLDAFHRRGEGLGFFGHLDARVQIDPRTGLRQFTLFRIDEDCLAAAESRHVMPERMCASVTAIEIAHGVHTLHFNNRYLNHQLQFTLMPSRDNPSEWSMIASRRRGEPQTLTLQLGNDNDTLKARWSIKHESVRATFSRDIDSVLSLREVQQAQFTPFELGMLSSLNFFDDLSDEHRDWVLFNEQVDVMEPPELGEGDIYGCRDVGGVCGAEYDTCIPNGGSWLGCNNYPGDPPWGGAHDDNDPGGSFDPNPLGDNGDGDPEPDPKPDPNDNGGGSTCDNDGFPDWVVGSETTNPQFQPPTVLGAKVKQRGANGVADDPPVFPPSSQLAQYLIRYEITSLLQSGSTQPVQETELDGEPATAHVVLLTLRDLSGDLWCDIGPRYQLRSVTSTILAGDFVTYRDEGDAASACVLSYSGSFYYRLHYALDPYFRWLEGAGESGNTGTFRGVILPPSP